MLRVADIMTKSVFVLNMDASVEEAAWAMSRQGIGGAPVRDSLGRLSGFVSKSDLVNPSWEEWVDRKKATVGDVMHPTVLTLQPDHPAIRAAEGMSDHNIHHVVIVDHNRHLVGIVSSLDIVKAVASGRLLDTDDEV